MRTYCLLIELKSAQKIKVGNLGTFEFPRGYYIYTGSALKNLDARIARHFSKKKRKHWHIDYLLDKGRIVDFFVSQKKECELNSEIFKIPGAITLAEKFGSSDCRCGSHLAYLGRESSHTIAYTSLKFCLAYFNSTSYACF